MAVKSTRPAQFIHYVTLSPSLYIPLSLSPSSSPFYTPLHHSCRLPFVLSFKLENFSSVCVSFIGDQRNVAAQEREGQLEQERERYIE